MFIFYIEEKWNGIQKIHSVSDNYENLKSSLFEYLKEEGLKTGTNYPYGSKSYGPGVQNVISEEETENPKRFQLTRMVYGADEFCERYLIIEPIEKI